MNDIKHFINKVKNLNENLNNDSNQTYFINIINRLYPNLNKNFLIKNKSEIKNNLINRAKENLDSKPSENKLDNWSNTIDILLTNFENKGTFKINDNTEEKNIRLHNFSVLKKTMAVKDEIGELPDYLLNEVGFDTIINYLKSEDEIQIFKIGLDFSKKIDTNAEDDEISRILNKPENKATWNEISDKLKFYYVKRLFMNIPKSEKFESEKEAEKFVKVYTQKFIYQYLIPMSKNI